MLKHGLAHESEMRGGRDCTHRRSALGRATQSEESSNKGIVDMLRIVVFDMLCNFMNGRIGKVIGISVWSSSQSAVAALAPSPAISQPPAPSRPAASPSLP